MSLSICDACSLTTQHSFTKMTLKEMNCCVWGYTGGCHSVFPLKALHKNSFAQKNIFLCCLQDLKQHLFPAYDKQAGKAIQ